jgi:hypothetical protein
MCDMLTTRHAHVLIAVVAATVVTGVALALSAGHSRTSFLTPPSPAVPSAARAPFPGWAHGGATAHAVTSPAETGQHQLTEPPTPRDNGPADAQHEHATAFSAASFPSAVRLARVQRPESQALAIPTPPPRAA